ncbi:hypothetical protein KK120_10445 [Virgibacillus dakarensis]|nr:hypothetical protein [Virgibacillus dakarensis]
MKNDEKIDNAGIFFDQFHKLHQEFGRFWFEEILFHWEWSVSLLLSIGAWIFWVFYRKKDSTHRLLYAGILAVSISVCLDYIGTALGLWYYVGKLIPTFPAWMPFHFCLLPVAIMFLIQTKPHIAPWKKGILFGLLTSFIGEPIFEWAGIYV